MQATISVHECRSWVKDQQKAAIGKIRAMGNTPFKGRDTQFRDVLAMLHVYEMVLGFDDLDFMMAFRARGWDVESGLT
jgi:hypothetical protein